MKTSIGRKTWMALTGLFLCVFLIVHLAGNLTLLLPEADARTMYNAYSAFLVGNPLVKVISWVLYASILAHVVVSLVLTIQNRRARGDEGYAYERPSESSSWHARSMGLLGTVLLVFLVIHMKTFWFEYHWGEVALDAEGNKDLYGLVVAAFSQTWYVALYVVSMIALGYHLVHGTYSACRTLGLHHRRYAGLIEKLAVVFAIGISAGFALLPVWIHVAFRDVPNP